MSRGADRHLNLVRHVSDGCHTMRRALPRASVDRCHTLMIAMFRDRSHVDWDRPLFSLGGSCYSRSDVVVAAILRGDWARLEDRTRSGLACVKRARGGTPPSIDLQKAVEEFRYARNLITVEE